MRAVIITIVIVGGSAICAIENACEPFGQSNGQGTNTPDSGVAVASPPDAGFCANSDAFCDDFERPDVQGQWQQATNTGTGATTLSIDSTISDSPQRSLHVAIPFQKTNSINNLFRPVSPSATKFEISFAIRMAVMPSDLIQVAGLSFQDSQIYIAVNPGNQSLQLAEQFFIPSDGGGKDISIHIADIKLGVFVHYTLTVDLAAGHAIVVSSDQPSLRADAKLALAHTGPKSIGIGNRFAYPRDTNDDLWFDNVTVR